MRPTSHIDAWPIDWLIDNHVESVLSANFEREQGQSGAHIRWPYTGAKKGKETMLLDRQIMKTMINDDDNDDDVDNDDNEDDGTLRICDWFMCGISIVWKALLRLLCCNMSRNTSGHPSNPLSLRCSIIPLMPGLAFLMSAFTLGKCPSAALI